MAFHRWYDEGDGGGSGEPIDSGAGTGSESVVQGGDTTGSGASTDTVSDLVQGGQPGDGSNGFDLFETARSKYGVDLSSKYKTPDEAVKGLLHASSLVGRRNEEAELGRMYRDYGPEFMEFLRSKQTQIQQQQAQPEVKPWWNPPEVSESQIRQYVQRNPVSGEIELAENTPIEVRRAIEARQQYMADFQYKLVNNPREALRGMMEEYREEILSEAHRLYGTSREIDRRSAEANHIYGQVQGWVYQRDDQGRVLSDDQGRPAFTPHGAYYTRALYQLKQAGMTDQSQMHHFAMAATKAAFTPSPSQQQEIPAAIKPVAQRQTPGPTRPKSPGQKGKSLAEKLMKGADKVPDKEFV